MSSSEPIGETNLTALLRDLRPILRPEPYVFCTVQHAEPALRAAVFAFVREDEGLTLILPEVVAREYGLAATPLWACITLLVHSSLEAVGMMAAISTRLAAHGISTNPIAGFYHDHVFVQWQLREQAQALLQEPW